MAKAHLCALITTGPEPTQCGVLVGGRSGRKLPKDRHMAVKLESISRAIVCGRKKLNAFVGEADLS